MFHAILKIDLKEIITYNVKKQGNKMNTKLPKSPLILKTGNGIRLTPVVSKKKMSKPLLNLKQVI